MSESKIRFNKTAIDKLPLPAQGRRATWFDDEVKGLALRVTSSGAKSFYLVRWIENRAEWVRLGGYPAMTVEQARKAATKLNGEIANGRNPADVKREKRAEMTLREAFDTYLNRYAIPHGLKTIPAMRDMFDLYLGKLPDGDRKRHGRERTKPDGAVDWTNRKLSAIRREDVTKLHANLGLTCGTYSSNRMLELLRAIFNRLNKMGLISLENPAAGVEKFREQKRDRFLQADEIPRFFAALGEVEGEATRDALLLLLLTGARRNNVLAMRWEDLDLTLGRWRIPSEHSKNGDVLVVPLTSATLEILKRRQQGAAEEYVFSSDSKTGYITPPKGAWQRLLKRADLTGVRLHDLRRSLASWMVIEGASLVVTGGALGHKDPQSTAIYARLSVDPVKHAMEKAQSAILGLVEKADKRETANAQLPA